MGWKKGSGEDWKVTKVRKKVGRCGEVKTKIC